MRCPKCGAENKNAAKFCGQCGSGLAAAPDRKNPRPEPARAGATATDAAGPFWRPDWRWHVRTLLIIYAVLTALYFVLNIFLSRVPEPYRMRDIPREITPWLKR